jgi:hypothetical protein
MDALISSRSTRRLLLSLIPALALISVVRAAEPATEDPAALATQYAQEAKQYAQQATHLRAEADKHATIAKAHRSGASGSKTAHESIAKHCEGIAADLRAAADESDALAATFRELAGQKK